MDEKATLTVKVFTCINIPLEEYEVKVIAPNGALIAYDSVSVLREAEHRFSYYKRYQTADNGVKIFIVKRTYTHVAVYNDLNCRLDNYTKATSIGAYIENTKEKIIMESK
jgi:hypothetical protein